MRRALFSRLLPDSSESRERFPSAVSLCTTGGGVTTCEQAWCDLRSPRLFAHVESTLLQRAHPKKPNKRQSSGAASSTKSIPPMVSPGKKREWGALFSANQGKSARRVSSTALDHLKRRERRRMVAYRFCQFGCAVVPLLLVVSNPANIEIWVEGPDNSRKCAKHWAEKLVISIYNASISSMLRL